MRTLIANGTVVTATDIFAGDVWIEDDKVLALVAPGQGAFGVADRTVEARGCYVLPGGVDVHTHLDMPFGGTHSSDDFYSGTAAAAYGGTTTLVDFAIQQRGQALRAALDTWHAKAEGKAFIDYGFHMIITDAPSGVLQEMAALVREGITSFKLFMAYPNVLMLDDQSIFRCMLRAGEIGALICMHAETGLPIDVLIEKALAAGHTAPIYHALTRPEVAEATGTERAIALAEMANVPVYMVHLSCARALQRVMEGRDRGLPVHAETCPQYLFCSEDQLRGTPEDPFAGAKYVCTPPLRAAEHQEALWRGLRQDDLQVVATDHCPFCMKQKALGRHSFAQIPNGMPGIETRQMLLFEAVTQKKISLNRWVNIAATAPAKLFGLYPRKGTLAPGCDADVVVWDPARRFRLDHANLHMKADYSPYEGREVPGSPTHVLSRGALLVENGQLHGRAGWGQFQRRSCF